MVCKWYCATLQEKHKPCRSKQIQKTVSLTPFSITNTKSINYKKNPYLVAIIAAYVSTYVCGISTKHMEYNDDTPGIITSMVRYHLYYQISKFLTDPSKLDRYITHVPNNIKKHKPTSDVWTDVFDHGSEEINTWLSEHRGARRYHTQR